MTATVASATRALAEFVVETPAGDIPSPVRVTAERQLLDTIAVALAAAASGAAEPVRAVAAGLPGPFGTALVNGTLAHALDFDDTHPLGLTHVGAVVVPAAFAVGEDRRCSGADVLAAIALGYEVLCRLAAAAPQRFHARGAHATSVCGAVAAAATAARLLGLGPQACAHAMGIATGQAGGLLEFARTGGDTKPFQVGWAAAAGVLAGQLAAAGMRGPAAALEGDFGLYAVLAGQAPDPAALLGGLRESWLMDAVVVKPYPSCHLMHATLDAAAVLRSRLAVVERIGEIVVRVPATAAAIVCEPPERKWSPSDPHAAKFSLQWSVAAMLLDGAVGVGTYRPEQLLRPELTDLARRVRHEVVDYPGPDVEAPGEIRAAGPDGWVTVTSGGGKSRPDAAAADAVVRRKLHDGIGTAADDVRSLVDGLATAAGLDALCAALRRLGWR